ncbi:hypothetical protein MSAN_01387800 [Mycena sanguinolenta]|uniref:Uncharacterized protein n=1 Tax=Mycena sanguinolenta TaxID=230812 RepID=A0A8H6Y5S3_9AGAR|nr:hypothetical protein MSAN_01387800 [Mycena sanguinolenta]
MACFGLEHPKIHTTVLCRTTRRRQVRQFGGAGSGNGGFYWGRLLPRLRKLRIKMWSEVLRTDILVSWAQLTDPTLDSFHPNITLDILAQCTSLIQATVTTNGWALLPAARQDILALGHLRALNLCFYGEVNHFVPILDRLVAPELEELGLDFEPMEAVMSWVQTRFTAFQLRAPQITRLKLRCSYLTSDDLRTAIHHAPSLSHLQITGCKDCFDDELLGALHYKAGVSPLAPPPARFTARKNWQKLYGRYSGQNDRLAMVDRHRTGVTTGSFSLDARSNWG